MDRRSFPISYIMSANEVICWHGVNKVHIYLWFLFESEPYQVEILEDQRLQKKFNDLESIEKDFFYVRYPVVFFTDLEKRKKVSKVVLWDWHVVHYILASDNGFPSPMVGSSFDVYIIFCYGCICNKDKLAVIQEIPFKHTTHGCSIHLE
jgi:hypothetical protein